MDPHHHCPHSGENRLAYLSDDELIERLRREAKFETIRAKQTLAGYLKARERQEQRHKGKGLGQ
ncbi:hypothetical protein VN12_11695 [Pirellula sp. SH-Sr6A]|nr:hypothetical protein VN12_11695 [Pirellula sp. SH-Sr6A]